MTDMTNKLKYNDVVTLVASALHGALTEITGADEQLRARMWDGCCQVIEDAINTYVAENPDLVLFGAEDIYAASRPVNEAPSRVMQLETVLQAIREKLRGAHDGSVILPIRDMINTVLPE